MEEDEEESEAKQAVLDVLVPPLEPLHPQDQGPDPANDATVPDEQRFGLLEFSDENEPPFAEPQAPFTRETLSEAEHAVLEVLVPPPEPLQPHVHGPDPENDATVPLAQREELPEVSDE